jgi:hypothetical protein
MKRRLCMIWLAALGLTAGGAALAQPAVDQYGLAGPDSTVERWGAMELSFAGPTAGNPFIDVELSGVFRQGGREIVAAGFYDGDGQYKIRFMPDAVGAWTYETRSNARALNGQQGALTAVQPAPGNHGPVSVRNTYHFGYGDGTPYWQVGTTSYAWTHQSDALQEQTLKTLSTAPFNKIRMAIFPNNDDQVAGQHFPFMGKPPHGWDLSRFDPVFFRNLERRVAQLRALGIEADLILFHPYDKGRWGFDRLPAAVDDRYLRYVVARLSAYRNVWWSMANEFDLMTEKKPDDWDRYFRIVQASDPYHHLRSIHNAFRFYDHNKPWVTHVSIQHGAATEDPERAILFRDVYNKPVVFDEVKYEGNWTKRWGQLTPQEMVLRFWNGAVAGSYVGHSEIYRDDSGKGEIWLGKGGTLRGQSAARLAFFRKILAESPAEGLEPIDKWQEYPFAGKHGEYYLGYFNRQQPASWPFALFKTGLKDGMRFKVEVIDTWNMTITPVDGVFEIKKQDDYMYAEKTGRSVPLPGRPYMAIRIVRVP